MLMKASGFMTPVYPEGVLNLQYAGDTLFFYQA
jgi:hypothetical protein